MTEIDALLDDVADDAESAFREHAPDFCNLGLGIAFGNYGDPRDKVLVMWYAEYDGNKYEMRNTLQIPCERSGVIDAARKMGEHAANNFCKLAESKA